MEHKTTITGDDLGLRYWASCTCGWAPYAQMSHTDAKRLTRVHKQLQRPRPTRKACSTPRSTTTEEAP